MKPVKPAARKGMPAPVAVVRDESVTCSGLTRALRLLPDGGPDLKALVVAAYEALQKIEPFAPDDTIYVRHKVNAKERVGLIRNEKTPDCWDVDRALVAVGQAIFASFEAPTPTNSPGSKYKASAPKAAMRQPANVIDATSAREIYAARRK